MSVGINGISIPFTPTAIPGLSVWVDTADSSSFTLSGTTVTGVTDKASGTAYTVQGTPTYSATNFVAPNGVNYPGFDMTNGRFFRALTANFTTFQHTAFIVSDLLVNPGNGFPCVALATGTGGSGQFYRVLDYITAPNFRTIAFTASLFQALGPPTLSPFIWSSDFDGSRTINSRLYTATANAIQFGVSGTGSAFTSNAGAVMIGTDGFTGNQNFNSWTGIVSEVLIYGNTVLTPTQREQVEGYLARKWGMLTALPVAHPARSPLAVGSSAGSSLTSIPYAYPLRLWSIPRTFDPFSIPNMALWLDATDSNTITFSTSPSVSEWLNKVPGGTSAFAFGSPEYGSATLNGRPSITMGSNRYFSGQIQTAVQSAISGNTITCFAVAFTDQAMPNPSHSQRLLSLVDATGSDSNSAVTLAAFVNLSNSFNITTYRNNVNVSETNIPSFPFIAGLSYPDPFIVANVYDGTNGQLWKNGTAGTGPTASAGNFGITKYSLGYILNQGANSNFWIGNISEVMIYRGALNTNQRQTIEGYLAWKWGLQGNLPANHPFKNFPPPP